MVALYLPCVCLERWRGKPVTTSSYQRGVSLQLRFSSSHLALNMANLSNSSISALLDYDGTLPPIIEPCSLPDANGNQIDVNCTQICNDSVAIFDTDNLLICGLWVMVSSNNPYTSPNGSQLNASDPLSVSSAFAPFQNVGFDTSSLEATATYGELISAILLRIYVAVRRSTTSDDGTIPWSCTTVSLFDLGGQEGVSSGFSGCLDAICSPRTLNPDLAGIGVSPLH